MASDRGGLNYRIKIVADTKGAIAFREEIKKAREEFAKFKSATKSGINVGRGLAEQVRATQEVSKATRELAAASRERTRAARAQISVEEAARQRAKAAARERAIQTSAEQQRLDLSRRIVKALSVEEAASKRVEAAIRKKAVSDRAAAIAGERAVQLGLAKARAATVEEEAARRVEQARRRLEVREAAANLAGEDAVNLGLRKARALTIEEQAERVLEAAKRRREVRERAANLAGEEAAALGLRKARALSIEEIASQRIERVLKRQAVARAQIAQLQAKGLRVPDTVRREAQGFDQDLGRLDKRGSNLLFTFRRLFGVLALFQGVRLIFRSFLDAIKTAVQFNAVIQQSELALAALFTAVGDVRNALGQTVPPAQELELATQAARKQIQLLRQDAINTQATFEELLETFQTATAPGLTAGLTIDQIREFTVRISQAASALGVAQDQLSEEIRSILSGTIQARTTRIATALGITNEDIRRAKELGVLFQFLQGEFAAFEAAGDRALETFTGLTGRIRDAVQAVLGLAGENLFNNVLGTLRQIFDLLNVRDLNTGLLKPDPRVVTIFEEILNPLSEALTVARELTDTLTFEDVRRSARALGQTLQTVLQVAVGIIEGLIAAVGTLSGIFEFFFGSVGRSTREIARDVAKFVTLFIALVVPARAVLSSVAGILSGLRETATLLRASGGLWAFMARQADAVLLKTLGIEGASKRVVGFLKASATTLLTWAAILTAIVLGFQQVFQSITGLDVTIGDTIDIILLSFQNLFAHLGATIKLFFKKTVNDLVRLVTDPIGFIAGKIADILGLAAGAVAVAADLGAISEETRVNFESAISKLEQAANKRGTLSKGFYTEEELDADRRRIDEVDKEFQDKFAALQTGIATRGLLGPGFEADFASVKGGIGDTEKTVRSLLDVFKELPPVVSSTGEAIQKLDQDLAEIRKTARQVGVEFEQAISQPSLTGVAQQIQGAFNDAEQAAREQTFSISQQIVQTEERIAVLRENQIKALDRANQLTRGQRDNIFSALEVRAQQVNIERQIAEIDKEIRVNQLAVRKAQAEGGASDELVAQINLLREKRRDLELERQQSEEKLKGATIDENSAAILTQLATTKAELVSTERDLNDLIAARGLLEQEQLQVAVQRAAITAAQRVPQLQQENAALREQAITEQALSIAAVQRLTRTQQAVLEAERALETAKAEVDLKLQQQSIELKRTEELAAQAKAGSKEKEQLDALVEQLRVQLGLETEISDALLRQAAERARLAALQDSGSITQGLMEGLRQFATEFATQFEIGVNLAKTALQGLASTAASVIVDSFDPNSSSEDRKAKIAQFLQSIAQQLLEQLIALQIGNLLQSVLNVGVDAGEAAVKQATEQALLVQRQAIVTQETLNTTTFATAVTGYGTATLAFGTATGVFGGAITAFAAAIPAYAAAAATALAAAQTQLLASAAGGGVAKGGWISGSIGAASAAHFSSAARGYDAGGHVAPMSAHFQRPAGLDPRDTIPAWIAKGEYIFSPEAVANLGVPFLEWLHSVARNGFSTGPAKQLSHRRSKVPGFAEGGLVSDKVGSTATSTASGGGSGGNSGGPSQAFVVADQETFARLLAKGKGPMLNFMRENNETLEGIRRRGSR